MKHLSIALIPLILFCASPSHPDDAEQLAKMIAVREKAMIEGDVDTAMSQFSDDATWINSQGYFFEGKQNVLEFHGMLAKSETRGYTYEAGSPKIRLLDASNAIAYYSWKMFWFDKNAPDIIVNEEIGLMTLTAQKRKGVWRWIAVTNQHTPTFYGTIDPVTIHDE